MRKMKFQRMILVAAIAFMPTMAIASDPLELDFDRPELTIEEPHDVSSPGIAGAFAMGLLLVTAGRLTRKKTGDKL